MKRRNVWQLRARQEKEALKSVGVAAVWTVLLIVAGLAVIQ